MGAPGYQLDVAQSRDAYASASCCRAMVSRLIAPLPDFLNAGIAILIAGRRPAWLQTPQVDLSPNYPSYALAG
jgi:hypothetical protein